jgi:O-antigen/teichoic acid export membrane protein
LSGLLALAVLLLAANQLIGESLRGIGDLRGASLFGGASGGMIANVLFLVAFFALALGTTLSLTTTVAISVSTLAVALVLAIWTARRTVPHTLAEIKPIAHASLPALDLRAMLWLCLPVFLNQAVWFIALQADLWIAGANLSLDAVALYGAARRLIFLVGLPLELLNATIVASIPRMYAARDFDGLQRLIRRSTTLAIAPALLALMALWVAPAGILHLFFGNAYRGAAVALMILAVGQGVASWVGPAGVTLMMTGRHVAALCINAVGAVALFAVAPFTARAFGLTGLAVAAAGIFAAQRLAEWFLARRMVGVATHFSWAQLRGEIVDFSRRLRS